ncbi:hypothetical protein HME9304_00624 [Flagellimonas maritima]|uniref:RagB/SusD family nutrient uptake outer membrane protein n=2 Tax=Flagellimonas maritima TaxID=1383885 RepID=A0A2Z4LPD9_9FLAO|nr:hypothetical protein HME9304_00624 [Allomuricauda aurantiaca]
MKKVKNNKNRKLAFPAPFLRCDPLGHYPILLVVMFLLMGCSDFVEVEAPKNILISETVFNDSATVESALANLYYDMREQGMVAGTYGLTPVLGMYSDELDYYGFNADYTQLFQHNVLSNNTIILDWWKQAYHLIYGANDIIKGVVASDVLTPDETKVFKGQALFVRAYIHSLLVSLFGDVPYIKTTDYRENNIVSRMPQIEVYENIISDLEESIALLEGVDTISPDRVLPDDFVAKALLARVYLYVQNWEKTASLATVLINAFQLETDLDRVFLKGSQETLWQLRADADFPKNTREAVQMIIQTIPGQTYALTDDLLGVFENGDLRLDHWVGSQSDSDNTITLYYAHKYKAGLNETESLEYSILFRLAEQFLIRAEARVHMEDILGARTDLDVIRNRAGLPNTTANTENDLLEAILRERRVELFTEQGHRWFDLKRTDNAGSILGAIKPNWQETHTLLPIPETEFEANPKLLPQNPGY